MAMAALLSASMSIPAYAFTPSTNTEFSGERYTKGVDTEQEKEYTEYDEYTNTDTAHETSKETEVYATIGSTFSYVLPKIVTLDGQDRGGKYRVRVKGDIAGSQKISIVPDASFTMSEVNASVDKKADITASVEQGKTEQNQTEINKDDYNDEIGTITADDISAGSWSGTFNFNTKLENTVPKKKTYVLKADFRNLIPSSATSVVFTDEVMPSDATMIDVDEDGDGGVVGWLDGTVFKVSTQKSGQKVVANADASAMFSECSNLTTLDLSGFDTSNVTDMCGMFFNCSGLTTLDLSGFDTSNVMDMRVMFHGCSGLTTLDVTGWNTSNVTSMDSMFRDCSNLTTLDLSGFDTSEVMIMDCMFSDCSSLTTIYIGDKWKTASSHDDMFYRCRTSTLTHK